MSDDPWGTIIRGANPITINDNSQFHSNSTSHSSPQIEKLSDDVLRCIFDFLISVDQAAIPTIESQISDCIAKDAVRYASQVCSRWRHVALDMRALWNQVDIGKYGAREWSELLVKRSHPLPLKVRCFKTNEFLSLVEDMQLVSRLHMLAVWNCTPRVWETVLAWLSLPTSQLEIFSFNSPRGCAGDPFLPLPRFYGPSLALQKLYLSGCVAPLDSPLFEHLRFLRIDNSEFIYNDDEEPLLIGFTEYDLLSALARMPLLTKLDLIEAFAPEGLRTPPQSHLPHLAYLKIEQYGFKFSGRCSLLLDFLKVPKTCVINRCVL